MNSEKSMQFTSKCHSCPGRHLRYGAWREDEADSETLRKDVQLILENKRFFDSPSLRMIYVELMVRASSFQLEYMYLPSLDGQTTIDPQKVVISLNEDLACSQERMAVLCHQLVHAIGGTELDAMAVEALIFPEGFPSPREQDFEKFIKEGGRWFRYDPSTGHVNDLGGTPRGKKFLVLLRSGFGAVLG